MTTTAPGVLTADGLDRLVAVLRERGYRMVGPTVRDGAIVLGELDSAAELPSGWGVEVGPGQYRLRRRADAAMFGHSAGPQSARYSAACPTGSSSTGWRRWTSGSAPELSPEVAASLPDLLEAVLADLAPPEEPYPA